MAGCCNTGALGGAVCNGHSEYLIYIYIYNISDTLHTEPSKESRLYNEMCSFLHIMELHIQSTKQPITAMLTLRNYQPLPRATHVQAATPIHQAAHVQSHSHRRSDVRLTWRAS